MKILFAHLLDKVIDCVQFNIPPWVSVGVQIVLNKHGQEYRIC